MSCEGLLRAVKEKVKVNFKVFTPNRMNHNGLRGKGEEVKEKNEK